MIEGDFNVGKTQRLLWMTRDRFCEHFDCPIGVNLKARAVEVHGKVFSCSFWDKPSTAQGMGSRYKGVLGIWLVYDITDRKSFMSLQEDGLGIFSATL
jgi:GTPase SAR1 family protein